MPRDLEYPKPALLRVQDLPEQQQPRAMLDRFGPEHVPDAVLLAILLRSGARGMNVVDLANDMLRSYGTLTELARASVEELMEFKGVGRVKAQMLKSALELARRMAAERQPDRVYVRTPDDVLHLLRETSRPLDQEVFWLLLLDTKNALKKEPVEVTRGILNASLVHPREVFREAIRSAAAAVVLVHNHPSGDPSPSREDLAITRQLIEASKILEIDILDHVILGQGERPEQACFSLRESGLVKF